MSRFRVNWKICPFSKIIPYVSMLEIVYIWIFKYFFLLKSSNLFHIFFQHPGDLSSLSNYRNPRAIHPPASPVMPVSFSAVQLKPNYFMKPMFFVIIFTYLAWLISNFFGHNASSWPKHILETNKTSFASYSLHWCNRADQILAY